MVRPVVNGNRMWTSALPLCRPYSFAGRSCTSCLGRSNYSGPTCILESQRANTNTAFLRLSKFCRAWRLYTLCCQVDGLWPAFPVQKPFALHLWQLLNQNSLHISVGSAVQLTIKSSKKEKQFIQMMSPLARKSSSNKSVQWYWGPVFPLRLVWFRTSVTMCPKSEPLACGPNCR